ncbi:MAG: GGDEF domain-containing protein [Acetivibrionales bacterium]
MLYFRTSTFDGLTILANTVLLLGCAYEAWAIRILSGQLVKRRLHILTSVGIILICSITVFLSSPYRTGLIFSLQSTLYFLPSLFLSIILLDIDHFKAYNDYYGHVAGDDCLRQIGRVLADCISRSVDLAARYGGEEFACILPDTDIHHAVKIAERIRQRIQDLKIEHKKSPVLKFVTASFGVTAVQYSPEASLEEIIATADELLYKAKTYGRNQTEFAESKKHE